MTEDRTILTLHNCVRGTTMIDQVCSLRGPGRIVLMTGAAGSGKSVFARAFADMHGHPYWRLHAAESERSMLAGILHEVLGWHANLHRVDELYQRLVQEIRARELRCVLIDEGDFLDQSPRFVKLNILRDLADESGAAVIIFSTAALVRRFDVPTPYLEQVSSRIVGRVEFQRPTMRDAVKLSELIEGVHLDRDLVAACLAVSRGSIRPLMEVFRRIETAARDGGVEGALSLERAEKLGIWSRPQSAKTAIVPDPAREPAIDNQPVKGNVKAA